MTIASFSQNHGSLIQSDLDTTPVPFAGKLLTRRVSFLIRRDLDTASPIARFPSSGYQNSLLRTLEAREFGARSSLMAYLGSS